MSDDHTLIRRLALADAERYSALRLRALREHPEAFGASPESHPALEEIRRRFRGPWREPDTWPLGAFRQGDLVGLCLLTRPRAPKLAHKGTIYQMYVAPEVRRAGVGRALLEHAIARASDLGLEMLQLSVTDENQAAIALYRNLGFRRWGIEPAAIRVGERSYDSWWMVLELG